MSKFHKFLRTSLVFSVFLFTVFSTIQTESYATGYAVNEDLAVPGSVILIPEDADLMYKEDSLIPYSLSIHFDFCYLA